MLLLPGSLLADARRRLPSLSLSSVRVPFSPRLAVGSSPLSFASPRCCWCTVQATFLKEYKLVVVGGGGASPVPCLDLVLVQTSSNAFVCTIRLTSSAFVHQVSARVP
jgi:hypothetical protein